MTNLNLFSFYLYVVTMSLFIWDNVITPTLNTLTVITPTLNTPTIITLNFEENMTGIEETN
jgi:hypothetical protein